MKIKLTQRGDTIVEVLIAMAMLGIVLSSSYAVANRAGRIAQISRDRVQATQIIQQQAEGLRWIRDNKGWEELTEDLASASATFYLKPPESGSEWTIETGGPSDPGLTCEDYGVVVNSCERDSFYQYYIDYDLPGGAGTVENAELIDFTVNIQWPRLGAQPTVDNSHIDESTIVMKLAKVGVN